jgi:ATP-dependent helicase/DNAse subunit B
MPLTLVLGPANSAKAGEVLTAYGDAAPRGAVLVVPTLEDASHYSRELAERGTVLGGSVLTFSGLAGGIARRVGYSARRVSALQRERIARRVVERASLVLLADSARAPGFTTALTHLTAELERSLITPQRFTQALRAWAREDSARATYAEELASLYLGYDRALGRMNRVDAELYAWRALDALRADPVRWGTTPVFLYGFDDLTPLERDAVETLSRVVGTEVTVSLTYEAGRFALAARAEVVEELRPLATRVTELPAADDHYAPAARAALHELERRLFEPPDPQAAPIEPGDAVRLLEAGGERAEAELVAAEVLSLLQGGMPAEEITIVQRSPDRSAPLFERVLAGAGVPFAVQRSIPLARTALGRSLLALARTALLPPDAARAEDLLDYLRSPGLLDHPEIADGLELDVRREGLRTAEQARARLGWKLAEIDTLRDAEDPAAELTRRGQWLLAAPHRGAAAKLEPGEALDAHALAVVQKALGEIAELGERLDGPELIALLEGLQVPTGAPARPGAVLLAEPLAIRARRFRAVFVCGLQEGEFPLAGAGEPFLSDERRRELAETSGLRLRPREDALARERYLFYACVSRASECLVLSFRSSDEEGNVALRSPFIADVEDLLAPGWADRRRRRLLADVVWTEDEAPTERDRARSRAAVATAQATASPARRLTDRALAHVRHREVVSPGALESYFDCPVRWLVEKQLEPAPFAPDPDPMTRGTYMHAALEAVLRRLGTSITAANLARARRILEEVLAELPREVAQGASPRLREAAVRAIAADLRRYLDFEASGNSEWRQEGLELRFGFESPSLPPLILGEGSKQLRVRGVIDRVDIDGQGNAIVRDYKSGRYSTKQRGDRWRDDGRLQVALYMLVARELLGLRPVAGLYQPLSGNELKPRGVVMSTAQIGVPTVHNDAREPEQIDAVLDDAVERALALAQRLRDGDLTPCPETCSREGCAYPGICRAG